MGKQMVRCPRVDRVAVPPAMIHLLSCGTVDHGRSASSRHHAIARPPKSVTVSRFRCKIIIGLVRGKTPTQLVAGGLCALAPVYRVAHLFLAEGLAGMADKREDNGEPKVDERYASQVLAVVAGSPQDHGYLRPT